MIAPVHHNNDTEWMSNCDTIDFQVERERVHKDRAQQRKSLIGSGDRSERIRTYNYQQGRVKDHRVNVQTSDLRVKNDFCCWKCWTSSLLIRWRKMCELHKQILHAGLDGWNGRTRWHYQCIEARWTEGGESCTPTMEVSNMHDHMPFDGLLCYLCSYFWRPAKVLSSSSETKDVSRVSVPCTIITIPVHFTPGVLLDGFLRWFY